MDLSLPQLELELIGLLQGQGLPVEDIHLIGLLGKGSRATAFSVIIDGVHHVLKVYDSKDSLRAELRNLKKVTPRDRFLFSWQGGEGGSQLNLTIIEVPEGQDLSSENLTESIAERLAERLVELYRIRYRQRISLTSLKERLERQRQPFLAHIELLGKDKRLYADLFSRLEAMLNEQGDLFRTRKVRIHGDLWWPNVIVAQEDVYLIDWESVRRGDPAEDLAKLRIVIYWPRNEANPVYFWRSVEHVERVGMMMRKIIQRYGQLVGDDELTQRLRFYIPYLCVYELAQRYLSGHTGGEFTVIKNHILADEALRLIDDPLAAPPDLNKYGFFEAYEQSLEPGKLAGSSDQG